MGVATAPRPPTLGQTAEVGAASGILAGFIFLVAQGGMSLLAGGGPTGPLRLAASLPLGPLVISAAYPLAGAALMGLAVNTLIAALGGVGFALALHWRGRLGASLLRLIPLGIAFGGLLWLVNGLILSTLIFPQFTGAGLLLPSLFVHAIFYGAPLAVGVARLREA